MSQKDIEFAIEYIKDDALSESSELTQESAVDSAVAQPVTDTLDLSSLNFEAGNSDERKRNDEQDEIFDDFDEFDDYYGHSKQEEEPYPDIFDNVTVNEENCEAVYKNLSLCIGGNTVEINRAIELLKECADSGCNQALVDIGKIYSDPKSTAFNKILAFESFLAATKKETGYYYLGLCYFNGFGCDKKYESAVEMFLSGAERGEIDCICALGICREFGIGCDIDYEMAVALYAKAAEENHPVATNNLGGCYFYGHGVPQNREHAIELYLKAAELGNSSAECRLGLCCENGEGCEMNKTAAFEHYLKAAKAKNNVALYRLALCYDGGIGTEQNFAKAFACYKQAAKFDNTEAMYRAGVMLKEGRGAKKSASAAYTMFSRAAEKGHPESEYELGNCFFEGVGAVRDRTWALEHYRRAYEMDCENARAAFKIGICYLRGWGVKSDAKEAFEWFSKGTELKSRAAAYIKGECYFYGVGVEEDKAEAFACYQLSMEYDKSHSIHTVPCLLALAQCFEHGFGCEKDPSNAMKLYKSASDFGDPEAMYRMGRAIMSGVGVRAEYSASRIYFLRAARKGYIPAMLMMGILADDGKGIPQNNDDAKLWYTKAVNAEADSAPALYGFPERYSENARMIERDQIEATYRLGMLLTRIERSPQSYISAFENIAIAASMGHENAQTEISKIFVCGGDLRDYFENSFNYAETVFENGEEEPDRETLGGVMNKLGNEFFEGKGLLKKNSYAALRCYKTAAFLGNTDACYNYGWCLRHGVGIAENDAEAVKWLKLAADKGNVNACYSYGLCCEEGAATGIKNKREARFYYRKAAAEGHTEAAKRYILLSEQV